MAKNLRKDEAVLCAMQLIQKNGGEMHIRDIKAAMENTFPKNDYERGRLKSDGSLRWYNQLLFHSIRAYKSGFIQKNKGVWHLTPEGEQAMKLSVKEFSDALHKGYNEWLEKKKKAESYTASIEEEDAVVETEIDYEQASNQAEEGFRSYIAALNPYEFQDLVAALFRGMGYYTPFVAPKGKDGGIDIIAYHDALGLEFPRVKVQVKHYPTNPVSADVVRQLRGTLSHEGESGVVVTSGSFTNDAKYEARNSHKAITLIDFSLFISLWVEHYSKLSDEDKKRLPIAPIYFVKPTVG